MTPDYKSIMSLLLVQYYAVQLIIRAGNWVPDEQRRPDERCQKSWWMLYPGGKVQLLVVWLTQHVLVMALPNSRYTKDLQHLSWPRNSLVECLTATAKGRTTKLLYLLLSHMPCLGYCTTGHMVCEVLGARKVQVLSFNNGMCFFLS